ncbi:methyltransferase domain-containing protein [Aurantimonas sp. C2-6-R+9]|uniref:class I SAM-dependent methyltransferase n=1 Tax=unclassified Aurantimonas TaxID=2638230 RepID=UPI002E196422|nr:MULTISPECIES: methyltransferase domain-containing protein [unclassified Aurantimonas]MEC5291651.1 methyltransferase domain-containing protein [Aurantimonas sp. C2-3-R2]MEC5381791.1 methyltransferase domain-containing protein [Aurantimonas sp. C2-6-R+9]MEC5412735.1 methyltransferase domain-containing protein [Aurantimonas sp. C2-4-R8]
MNDLEPRIARHYGSYGVLERILLGLERSGADLKKLSPDQLKPVDEFHIGGADATARLLDRLAIEPGMHLLDIGSGIGGLARTIAQRFNCEVTGIDLTPDFVAAATALTKMCGMDGSVRFEVGNATALPLTDASFDAATLLHVGMNIADKAGLFREAYRVLRPGRVFAVYDVMKTGEGELAFPVPWAESAELSAVATREVYRDAARAAGFTAIAEDDRRAIALDFFTHIQAQAKSDTPPPLGLHLLMGPTIAAKMTNMIAAIRDGTIAPVEMIFRKPAS